MADLQKLLPNVQKDVSLAEYSLYKAGANAEYLYLAKDKKDAKKALDIAKKEGIKTTLIENNNFIAPDDVSGLVILIEQKGNNLCFKDIRLIKGEKKLKDESQGTVSKDLDARLEDWILESGKISGAWLIEQADLVGYKIGNVRVSLENANCMTNLGGATPEELVMMLSYIKQQIRDRFGVQLQNEVHIVESD